MPSEGLPYREKELEVTDLLQRCLTGVGHRALQQLRITSRKTVILRRVDAVGKIEPQRPDGRSVSHAETHRVNHIVEIRRVPLIHSKRYAPETRIDVSGVFEESTVNIRAVERKSKLGV